MALVNIELIHTFVFFKLYLRNRIMYFIKHRVILASKFLWIFLLPFLVDNFVRFCQMLSSELISKKPTRIGFFLLSLLSLLLIYSDPLITSYLYEIYPFLGEYIFTLGSLQYLELTSCKPLHIALTQHVCVDFEMFRCILANKQL